MIVTDLKTLRTPISRTEFKEKESEVAAAALFTALVKEGGIGLSANQIGLDKRICVINVKEPIFLVNPEVVERSEEKFTYQEGCLSLPRTVRKPVKTIRYEWIKVRADNFTEDLMFEADDRESWDVNPDNFWNDKGYLQSVVVQHEIDHLDGITIKERRYVPPMPTSKKFGRNERVMVTNPDNGDMEFMKFKHAQKLVEMGWKIQA